MLTMVMGRSRPGGSYCDIFLWILLTTLSACHHHARVQATKRLRAALKEKDVINAELRRATQAKSEFLANMSHGTRVHRALCTMPINQLMLGQTTRAAHTDARNHRHEPRASGLVHALFQSWACLDHHIRYMSLHRVTHTPSAASVTLMDSHAATDCAEHLMSLVSDILDFERIESDQLQLEAIPFSIAEEAQKAIHLLQTAAGTTPHLPPTHSSQLLSSRPHRQEAVVALA